MSDRPVTEEELHAYIDGRLDARRNDTVKAYLAAHPDTAETVAVYAADRQMLREALQFPPRAGDSSQTFGRLGG